MKRPLHCGFILLCGWLKIASKYNEAKTIANDRNPQGIFLSAQEKC